MDVIALLKNDHRTVEGLFARFEKAKKGQKRKIVDEIIRELAIHASVEETLVYPAARKLVKSSEDQVLESLEEHHIVKWTLDELRKMSADNERFEAKVTVLKEMVGHHVKEEETELLPKMKKALSKKQLADLGEAVTAAKKVAPTRPHPSAPDTPPGNLLASAGASVVDRVRDAGRRMVDKVSNGARRKNGKATTSAKKNGNGARAATKRTRTTSGTHRVHRAA